MTPSETLGVRESLIEVARGRPVLADGAMGTELQGAGLEPGDCGELWNLSHADQVTAIQRRYVEAGCEVLLTNTFGANPLALARHEATSRTVEINAAAARISRAAGARWVLGDIGPFGGFIAPVGEVFGADVRLGFLEQATALVHAGVDGVIIETMSALDELAIAIEAARAAAAPMVVASVTYEATRTGLRTMTGATPEEAAEAMIGAGADIVGANCGTRLTIFDYTAIVRRYRAAAPGVPIMVQPNAGQPAIVDGVMRYDATPSAFADSVRRLVDAGAAIVGGCCGTTPDHISAAARVL